MRILFLLFLLPALILSSFGTVTVQADIGGEACIREAFEGPFPHVISDERTVIECISIDQVTAAFSNTSPVQIDLKLSGQSWQEMDNYGYAIQIDQWRDGSDLYIAVYREVVPVSTAIPNPYEQTIPLDGRFEAGTYTVHVNDYTFEIAIPDAPPPGSDAPPPYEPVYPSQSERRYAVIQDVDVIVRDTYPARVALRITGYHPDSCPAAVQFEQSRSGNWVYVEVYRIIDPGVRCRNTWNPLDETIRLEGTFERGNYIIQVNDYLQEVSIPYPPPPPPPPEPFRSYAVVENVEVLMGETFAYPPRLTLHVTGYHGDGCQGPLQIDQWRSGDWVYVEIYRLVDPRIMCPEMLVRLDEYIPLNGTFEYGTYVFNVNDYMFHYSIPPGPIYDGDPVPK